jgi:mono/diheme cytochrome c family protein
MTNKPHIMKEIPDKWIRGFSVFFASIALCAFVFIPTQDQVKPWDIPAEYKSMKNPYAGDESLAKVGKALYGKHCKSCHGAEGLGDGTKAGELETYPGDLTSDEYKEQAAGVKYFKSFIGRDEMPNYEKKILDEEDRWAVINYVDSLE